MEESRRVWVNALVLSGSLRSWSVYIASLPLPVLPLVSSLRESSVSISDELPPRTRQALGLEQRRSSVFAGAEGEFQGLVREPPPAWVVERTPSRAREGSLVLRSLDSLRDIYMLGCVGDGDG